MTGSLHSLLLPRQARKTIATAVTTATVDTPSDMSSMTVDDSSTTNIETPCRSDAMVNPRSAAPGVKPFSMSSLPGFTSHPVSDVSTSLSGPVVHAPPLSPCDSKSHSSTSFASSASMNGHQPGPASAATISAWNEINPQENGEREDIKLRSTMPKRGAARAVLHTTQSLPPKHAANAAAARGQQNNTSSQKSMSGTSDNQGDSFQPANITFPINNPTLPSATARSNCVTTPTSLTPDSASASAATSYNSVSVPSSASIIHGIGRAKATRPVPCQQPTIVRTTSSHGDLPLRHPIPDLTARSGGIAGNIAQLEETAEQLSRTGSIEDAIREAHQELKRCDSRRSSILAAYIRHTPPDLSTDSADPPLHVVRPRRDFSRQSSIIELNSAARSGMSADYIMSRSSSIAGGRQRSTSKASSSSDDGNGSRVFVANVPGIVSQSTAGDSSFPFLSRHGTGESSVHRTQSGKLSLPEIVELEPPTTLTQYALDEADRRLAASEDHDEQDTVCAAAHQCAGSYLDSPYWTDSVPPPSEHTPAAWQGSDAPQVCRHDVRVEAPKTERPTTSGSGATYEQAQTAFRDFDGVHYDPDATDYPFSHSAPSLLDAHYDKPPPPRSASPEYKPRPRPTAHPTSYVDPKTGQQMLFYPARVPAMLKVPPKLSKNSKAAQRNVRRSHILSMMAGMRGSRQELQEGTEREWLSDPISGEPGTLIDPSDPLGLGLPLSFSQSSPCLQASAKVGSYRVPINVTSPNIRAADLSEANESPQTEPAGEGKPNGTEDIRQPSRLVDPDRRKSRMSFLSKVPPQLRASAYFDAPSTTTDIDIKNGSATDTLDSILDAAVHAPVTAFTDHAFAGHLGSEVYGADKQRAKSNVRKSNTRKSMVLSTTENGLPTSKSRSSFFSLVGHIRKVSDPADNQHSRSNTDGRRPRRRLSKHFDHEVTNPSSPRSDGFQPSTKERENSEHDVQNVDDAEEDSDEHDSENENEEDEEDDAASYQGAPTTLLAELQLRKQQQKLRTRPINQTFPNGMHSTLLELDAVAEVERRTRKGKRVNLAWEQLLMDDQDGESDDDVPLGLLYAAKTSGHKDLSAVVAEMNRPLGLMEKKELEDNEPLSRRRDRLQGRDPSVSIYVGGGPNNDATKRQSLLTLTPTMAALNASGNVHASSQDGKHTDQDGSDAGMEEFEDEPLAARLHRIKEKEQSELPRARPVSTAFSAELLGQFAEPEEKDNDGQKETAKKSDNAKASPEVEETLGQRRRRLQAEKEARELEIEAGSRGPAVNGQALHALTGSHRLSRRVSMADMLSAYPLNAAQSPQNPFQLEQARREQDEHRLVFEREQKMAAMRVQMPRNISSTSIGGGITKPGGYLGGRFNDGTGGISTSNRAMMLHHTDGPSIGLWANPSTIGGSVGSASALNLPTSATMGSMGTMVGVYGSAGMGGMSGMGMNRTTSYGNYVATPQQPLMANVATNNGMAFGGWYGAGGAGYPGMVMQASVQVPMSMHYPMPVPLHGQIDRVEHWRQTVQR